METDEYCLTPPFRSNATFSPSMAMDVPKELLFLWKTPSASEPSKDIPAVSPLLSYPFILSMALKLIDLQDVVALMTSGNLALMAYLPRHCTSLRYGRRIGALQMAHQPVLKGDPFRTILRFPQLQTLSIISPSWTIPAYDGSPLLHLPRTLRHLTIWARSENTIFERTSFSTLGAISYADQFPDLETLRFCIQHSRDALEPKIKLSSIPKRIRTLSLLSRFFLDSMDIFRICQPVGREMELELLLEGRDKILPQAAFDSADDADPNIPHYRFPEIEHFECFDCAGAIGGSMGIVYHPSPLLMPPTLRSYNMKSDLSLSPLHTRREVREALRTTPSLAHGLRTFVLDSRLARLSQSGTHDWTSSLPSTLTELAVRNVNMEEIAKFDFSLHLPSLRSLTVFGSFDVNKVRLPDTLTSLNFTFVDSSWDPLFSVFPPPSSLTHLGLARISANGLLTLLPATLKSIHYYNWTGEEYLREQVLPYLPRGLRTLRLKVRSFNSNLLRFLPVDLEELSVVADTQIGTPFDLSDLPPRLASFILRTKENNLHFNALYFAQLPRTLRYLELAPVTLALSPLPVLPVAGSSTSTATTSASTGSFGFFSTVKTWIQKIVQDDDQDEVCDGFVKEETIKEALSLLPPDCWCKRRSSILTNSLSWRPFCLHTPSFRALDSPKISETLIDCIPASLVAATTGAASSAASSAFPQQTEGKKKKGLLDTIGGWFKTEEPAPVLRFTDEDIARALMLLPEDFWITTRFKARLPNDSKSKPAPQPPTLANPVALVTPGGYTVTYIGPASAVKFYPIRTFKLDALY